MMAAKLRAVPDPVEAITVALEGYPQNYLECREWHNWQVESEYRVVDTMKEKSRYPIKGNRVFAERIVRCPRCSMRRHDYYQITSIRRHTALIKIGNYYDQPPGYSVAGIAGARGIRDLIRGAAFDRVIASNESQESS